MTPAGRLGDDRIDRRVKNGNRDRGDIGGIRLHGQRIVVHKTHGTADPAQQGVTLTVEQLVALLTGRPLTSPIPRNKDY
ncbi:hypothetical protein [Rhodococcus indonesiensis]|uniref:hypothetical protein n=1 Tax=Rhodococcus indonesiensis TaxID=3055869 RepID=UPI0039F6A2F1